jgi:ubiquinone/menaquinone biosynthesis C-methylase UbiE
MFFGLALGKFTLVAKPGMTKRIRATERGLLEPKKMTDVIEQGVAPHTHGLVIRWAARYDLLAWLLTRGKEQAFRERLISLADVQRGNSVLDIGCGTGTLAIAATRHVGPTAVVHGIDASPEMIARARRKAAKAGADAVFQLAVAEKLPFQDGQFDVVLSTLMLHHLPRNTRQQCATEVRRVLKPGGRVLAVDFAAPQARRGLLAHFHRHGHVALEDIIAVLANAGLTIVRSGRVGVRNLQFVLAEAKREVRMSDAREQQ